MSIFQSLFFFFLLIQRPSSWRWRTVCITVWHHLTMMAVGQGMSTLPVDPSEQLPDSISTCHVSRGYNMLLLILFVLLLFVRFLNFLFYGLFVHFFPFFRDNHIIFISTVEFRYYVVIIILVDLGKP